MVDEFPDGHALEMDERLVAYPPGPRRPYGHGRIVFRGVKRLRERGRPIRRGTATARGKGRRGERPLARLRVVGILAAVVRGRGRFGSDGPSRPSRRGVRRHPSDVEWARTRGLDAWVVEAGDFDLDAFARYRRIRILTYFSSVQMLHTVIEHFVESRVECVLGYPG